MQTTNKRARKRQPNQTPPEWAELFSTHDSSLTRVRMLWRRGGGRYRPLVPVNLALEDLEALDFEEWEDLELPETHYEWAVPTSEAPDERERRLAETARELWAVAVHWTRAKGPVCDFQLRGYGGDENILFEDGKRCNLSGEQSRYDDSERERPPADEAMRAMIIDERAAWLQLDRVKDGLVGRLTEDREKLFGHLDRTTRAAPELIGHARDVLERAIEFQQRHFEEYMSRAGGKRELEARAFAEYQKTKRMDAALAAVKDMGASAIVALPALGKLIERVTGRPAQSLPNFKCAQQAMAYLYLSLEPERLAPCVMGEGEEKLAMATKMIALIDHYSRTADERTMLAKAEPLIRNVLSRQSFRAVASEEEIIAVQYVMGRAALFRVMEDQHEDA
jgi:hypothetical protein